MRAPFIGPGEAAVFLALLDFAAARSPEAPLAFLRGWLVRASTEVIPPASTRRVIADVESALQKSLPSGG